MGPIRAGRGGGRPASGLPPVWYVMVSARPNPGDFAGPPEGPAGDGAGSAASGNRLNLLLSCACWRANSWADRIPFLLEPMGVHSVRARSARQAESVIKAVKVHIAVVDMGLPLEDSDEGESRSGISEEAGPRVLELLSRLASPPPTVVVKGPKTSRDEARYLAAALRSGAFAVIDRSGADVEQMLEVLRRCLHRFYRGQWPDGSGGGGGSGGGKRSE